MAAFDVTSNPFHVLGVSLRSTRDDIADAYQDALVDGQHDEQALIQAHQALLGSKTRLEAELSWLLGFSPFRANQLIEQISTGKSGESILAESSNMTGLGVANALATLCTRFPGNKAIVTALLTSYEDVSEEDALARIAENRRVSGFPKADPGLIREILPKITEAHARAAAESISKAEHPGKLMTEFVEASRASTGPVRNFLEAIAQHFDTWSAPQLRDIKDNIDLAAQRIREDPSAKEPVEDIVRLLSEWDEYSQPAQLLEQAKGLDEQRSKELYDQLRDLCLWLANEQNEYEPSLAISKALLKTFPELPTVAIQASEDIIALESLIEDAKSIEQFSPLVTAVETCLNDLSRLDSDLLKKGFSPQGTRLAKTLYEAFEGAALAAEGTEHADVPWMMVRAVAIELNNSLSSPEAALDIIEGLLGFEKTKPSATVKERLTEDHATLQVDFKFEELKQAANQEDHKKALRLADEILSLSHDEDGRLAARGLKAAIEQRLKRRRRVRLFWGGAAAVVVGIWLSGEFETTNKPTYSPRSPPSTSPQRSFAEPPSTAANAEQRPPKAQGRVLTTAEVRYCVFQRTRLEELNAMTKNNSEVQKANVLVGDFNARCSDFRYRAGVLERIRKERAQEKSRLYLEALFIAQSWRSPSSGSDRTFDPQDSQRDLLNPGVKIDAIIIQKRLKELGFYTGSVDGVFGPESREALRNFRVRNGMSYADEWDRETQQKLLSNKRF